MKNLRVLPYALMGVLFGLFTACGSDDSDETCNAAIKDFGTCSAEDISVCSDNDLNSYYLYKGVEKTEEELDDICFPANASAAEIRAAKIELNALTQQLIEEVRLKAICQ